MKLKQNVLSGALCGLRTWIAYGVIEFLLACTLPLALDPDVVLLKWQWSLIAMLLGAYALFGVVIGAICGVLLACILRGRGDLGDRHVSVAAFSLSIVFVANLASAEVVTKSEYIALAIAILLAIGLG